MGVPRLVVTREKMFAMDGPMIPKSAMTHSGSRTHTTTSTITMVTMILTALLDPVDSAGVLDDIVPSLDFSAKQ
jgi:hypothetical protein